MSDARQREVRAIVGELQAAVRRRSAGAGEGAMPDPLSRVREKQVVNPHLPIGWPVMPRSPGAKLTAYLQKITRRLLRWYINPLVAQQNEYNAAVADALADFRARLERELLAIHRRQVQEFEGVGLRLQRLENWQRASHIDSEPRPEGANVATGLPLDYFVLGARFRNRQQMAPWLTDHDDLWMGLAGAGSARRVLDIGCGRGDYVRHLRELGLDAYGIDLDADALRMGQDQGLDLRVEDAFAHLERLPSRSLAAVVMIQVIEHFQPQPLLDLFRLIADRLMPDGLVLAETINPACLFALSNWYLMDPSHQMPVHSETARFFMEQAGLERVTVRFLHPVDDAQRLQPSPDAAAGVQANFDRLNHLLYGPQDYAAIGYKAGAPAER